SQLTLGRGISDRDILKSSDLPLAELTAELGRITTGDDIIGENIRMSSSEWVKDFQNGPVVVGPLPQSMFHDSFSSIPDATGSASRSVLGAVPARVRYDKNTPYDRALSPILSSGGVQINSSLPLPALSSNIDNRTENVFSGSLKDDKISSQSKTKKRRKRVIDESTACVPTEDDVLFGRGGFTNNRPGNIFFRQEALNLRSWYEQSSKEEKYNISNLLLESVKSRGGRFLEKGSDGLWHEVIGNGARRKASQALRERIKGRVAASLQQISAMPSKVEDMRASSSQRVKTKQEQLAAAREYAKTLSPARKVTKKSPTRSTTPKKDAAAATSPVHVKTPLSKEEQLARAREYGMKLQMKTSSSPVPVHRMPVPAVVIQSDMSMSDTSGSAFDNEPGSVGRKRVEPLALAGIKRLAEEAEAIAKEEEAKATAAAARAKDAKAKWNCLQAIIDENDRMDCD
ncbi:hypothetical protein ACHAW6_006315, partial [Cyclotella cf. meneghiniana]